MKRTRSVIQIFSVFLLFATPPTVHALSSLANLQKHVTALVARDLDGIFSSSYDAGQGCADVSHVSCRVRPHGSKGYIGLCSAEVEVQPSRASKFTKTVTCTSLRYNVSLDLQSVELVYGEEDCLSLVNGVSEY